MVTETMVKTQALLVEHWSTRAGSSIFRVINTPEFVGIRVTEVTRDGYIAISAPENRYELGGFLGDVESCFRRSSNFIPMVYSVWGNTSIKFTGIKLNLLGVDFKVTRDTANFIIGEWFKALVAKEKNCLESPIIRGLIERNPILDDKDAKSELKHAKETVGIKTRCTTFDKLEDSVGKSIDSETREAIAFAYLWAALMQYYMEDGSKVCDIAEKAFQRARIRPLSGYQCTVAYKLLCLIWRSGEELERWMNDFVYKIQLSTDSSDS